MVSVKVRRISLKNRSPERLHLDVLGQLTLRNLRLKKGALDKFRLPVDVIAGA